MLPCQRLTPDPGGCVQGEKVSTKSVAAVILGGGAGTRLYPLTKQRAKPAVPIGGAYRLIDVPMSNCINSGISKVYVLTQVTHGPVPCLCRPGRRCRLPPSGGLTAYILPSQFNSTSLNRHMSRTYNFGTGIRFGGDGFVEVRAAGRGWRLCAGHCG